MDEFEQFQRRIMSRTQENDNLLSSEEVQQPPLIHFVNLEGTGSFVQHGPGNNTESSESSQVLLQVMEMMRMMETNRQASEQRFLKLLENRPPPAAETRYHVMPDFSQSIENFNGESLGARAMDWLERLESTAMLHKWPEEFKLEAAKVHLVGTARKWFDEKSKEIKSFAAFKEKFKKTYELKPSKDELWEKMKKRCQRRGESLFSYFHDKVALCQALGYGIEEVKEQVLVGLYNKKIIPGLIATKPSDVDELLHEIVNFERINNKAHENMPSHPQRHVNQVTVDSPKAKVQGNDKQESRRLPERNEDGKPLCYICKKYGHVSKYCQAKRSVVCYSCKKEGHLLKNCPTQVNKDNVADVKAESTQMLVTKAEPNVSAGKFLRENLRKPRRVRTGRRKRQRRRFRGRLETRIP